jgi:hypothetical protein
VAYPIHTNAEVSTALDALVAGFPGLVTKSTCPEKTFEGRDMPYATIKSSSGPATKVQVIVIAGVHARELALPDALLSFLSVLLSQGTSGPPSYTPKAIRYAGFTRPDNGVRFPRCTISRNAVTSIINNLEIVALPLVNPDGREFVFSGSFPTNKWQRKNRRDFGTATSCDLVPPPGLPTLPPIPLDVSKGTDINRNFPIDWDVDSYYSSSFLTSKVAVAKTACVPGAFNHGESFRGDAVKSESETRNVLALVAAKDPTYFIDLHSAARTILYSWQLANTRTDDPTSNYQNAALKGTRDDSYGEYLPETVFRKTKALAGRMQATILKMRTSDGRSTTDPKNNPLNSSYAVAPESTASGSPHLFTVGLYPAPGVSIDAVTARQISTPVSPSTTETLVPPERYAITVEAGSDNEHSFWPFPDTEFPKIEREVHMALWGFLSKAAAPSSGLPVK